MRLRKFLIFLLVILLLALISIYWPKITNAVSGNAINDNGKEPAFVKRVIDGDTIDTDIGRIRLLGINTPEKSYYLHDEAEDYLREIENKSVLLLRDGDDVDKYNRKLRYIFYDNRIINVDILQNGYATSFLTDGLIYKDKLKTAEDFAMKSGIGLWEKSNDKCASCTKLKELNANDEYFIIENSCNFQCNLNGWVVKDDANHFFKLTSLNALDNKKYVSPEKIWNDDGDRFFMRDKQGKLVVYYSY